jgi:type I restriction enzyme M protein
VRPSATRACGTGGFLLVAYDYVSSHYQLDRDQWLQLRQQALHGWEIVDNTARLCVMNLYLHRIGHNMDRSPSHVDDSLATKPSDTYDMVLTNPPFGKKSSVTYITEDGEVKRESLTVVRENFWTSTSYKQLNFVQHVHKLLKQHGRAAVVVPDNVLFDGQGAEPGLISVDRATAAPVSISPVHIPIIKVCRIYKPILVTFVT